MKTNNHLPKLVCAFVGVLFGVTSIFSAQSDTSISQIRKDHPSSKKTTKGNKDRAKFTLRFTFEDGNSFSTTQWEDQIITIEREGRTLGFTPYLLDSESEDIGIKVYELTRIMNRANILFEDKMELQSLETRGGLTRFSDMGIPITIELVKIDKKPRPEKKGNDPRTPTLFSNLNSIGNEGTCCVTCNKIRSCACSVSMDCGECCVGECCGYL